MKRATINDVALTAGVSTFTASRALRGKDHVAAATRDKVLKAAKELNYTASRSAAALASGRTNRIAMLARERLAGWFMGELFDGLYDELSRARYDLTVYRAGSVEERAEFFTRLPANRNADALIVSGFSATDEEADTLASMGMPIVSVNSPYISCCQASVAIDDEAAEAMAVRYLAALGHRRFCYVGRTDPLTGKEWGFDARARGYKDEIVSLASPTAASTSSTRNHHARPNKSSPPCSRSLSGRPLSACGLTTTHCAWYMSCRQSEYESPKTFRSLALMGPTWRNPLD